MSSTNFPGQEQITGHDGRFMSKDTKVLDLDWIGD